MITPGKRCIVNDWNPHYAGMSGTVGELMDEVKAVVRIDECTHYPRGSQAILSISELEEIKHEQH